MKELSGLVELAKKATSGEWNAFISTGGDGTFSIHTPDDSRKGDVVNWPGFDTANCSKAQKKANAKYIAAANPATILAIAEAFRALEQQRDALAAENGLAAKAVQTFCDVVGSNTDVIAEEMGMEGAKAILAAMSATGNMPATDAYLNSVRAEGVEILTGKLQQLINEGVFDAKEIGVAAGAVYEGAQIAAQLRAGKDGE